MSKDTGKADALTYKGRPLIRKGNSIYYGSMADKFLIHLEITESETVGDLDVAKKVLIYLQNTNMNLKPKDQVVKKSEKDSLFDAMELAEIWLDRALAK